MIRTLLLILGLLSAVPPVQTTGTVSGQVLWADGAPSAGTRVSAIAIWETPGWKDASVIGEKVAAGAVTDDAGRYRIENLPPGRYHIVPGPVFLPRIYSDIAATDSTHLVTIAAGRLVENVSFAMVRNPDQLPYVAGRVLTVTGKLDMQKFGSSGGGVFVLVRNSDLSITKWHFRRPPGSSRYRGSQSSMYWWPGYDVLRYEISAVAEMVKGNETVTITGTETPLRYDLNPGLAGSRFLYPTEVTRGGR